MMAASTLKHPVDQTAQAAVEGIAERMAFVMRDNATYGCTIETLRDAGFSDAEIDRHQAEARRIATARFERDDGAFPAKVDPVLRFGNATKQKTDTPAPAGIIYDRAARVDEAVRLIGQLLPDAPALTLHLQSRGFAKDELDDIFDTALAIAADSFAHEGGVA